ncbi:hypothetical protein CH380_11505 [Leptospira adleri]|uniref:Uncharacterized protein n=1 Tax=Leptospira adleri TaxID=2023186 RepID=A0A2M9YNG0_9LEPT|nr:hypothetical protein CH380_11505 [Leptospira adleri]PJZ62595.1 hypothetical protein CH376_07285 [Leptospira adleri]
MKKFRLRLKRGYNGKILSILRVLKKRNPIRIAEDLRKREVFYFRKFESDVLYSYPCLQKGFVRNKLRQTPFLNFTVLYKGLSLSYYK